jgi:hypothetical protein
MVFLFLLAALLTIAALAKWGILLHAYAELFVAFVLYGHGEIAQAYFFASIMKVTKKKIMSTKKETPLVR